MALTVEAEKRSSRATAMIGFTDWHNPGSASTKMFAQFGEQYGHWSRYRIPDLRLAGGAHEITLHAGAGASIDALVLLSQPATMDRAAMDLFQNWNYAPWDNPLWVRFMDVALRQTRAELRASGSVLERSPLRRSGDLRRAMVIGDGI